MWDTCYSIKSCTNACALPELLTVTKAIHQSYHWVRLSVTQLQKSENNIHCMHMSLAVPRAWGCHPVLIKVRDCSVFPYTLLVLWLHGLPRKVPLKRRFERGHVELLRF